MTSREKRHVRQQLAAQIEQERNGAPIPGDIAARMTQPRPPALLYQVMVEQRRTGLALAVGPAWSQDAAGKLAEAIGQAIVAGRERDWASPTVVAVLAGQRTRIDGASLAA